MAIKMVISGESNAGKTTLTKDLEDSLVISHDGKQYPFPVPHGTISSFGSTEELINFVGSKVAAYKEKFGDYPKAMVFDSVSRIYETLFDACSRKFTGFQIYTQLDKEIREFAEFIETELVGNGVDVIIISHALYNAETNKYDLVGKGSFNKLGGFLSVVDEAIFVEPKNDKRVLHFRATKFPARTLTDSLPDNVNSKDFNLQEHINVLRQNAVKAASFEL